MGSGFKTFTAGSVLTASDVNNYLMEQSVMVFSSSAARSSAISSPEVGMTTYLTDTGSLEVYYGATTGWRKPWAMPWGVLGSQVSTTAFATSSTHTAYQDAGLSCSVAYVTNRILKVTWAGNFYTAGGVQSIGYKMLRGSTTVREGAVADTALSNSVSMSVTLTAVFTTSSTTTETFKGQIKAWSANTAVNDYADASAIRSFIVEDLGPSGNAPTA